ncbi:MAG: hypothetical protein V7K92_21515 [Nostoc sp.]|uniref:hypothetical protein n=1 Tax=Nostoc sp. TaxID=1180 RepID=UPI002FF42C08
MNRYAVWFRRIVWLGVIQDWAIGLPAIFAPNWLLELLHQRPTQDPVWTSFAGLLVVLLSLFYIPGANDPYRYTPNAVLATFSRPPGVIFFFFIYPNIYPAFGIIDLVLCLFQIPLLILTMLNNPKASTPDNDVFEYNGSTYKEVKEVGFSGPYGEPLPYQQGVGLTTFVQLFNDAARNLFDRRDIRPYYDKLIHANGVCYTGVWKITEDSPYTGYFAKGSEGLVFARLSVAGTGIKRGDRRALGLAGKVYPTLNLHEKVKPGNFVTVDYLTGIKTKHITDTELTNFPDVGPDIGAKLINRVIFRLVDKRPGFRQVFPISTLGVEPGGKVVTPDLFMLRVAEGTPKIDAEDFRDELRLEKYPNNTLVYTINVKNFDEKEWTKLGVIELNDYAICEGCDKRIHFWIPRDIPVPKRDSLARASDPVVIK